MHSLRSVLELRTEEKSSKVQNLLSLLDELDIKTDVHICSIGGVGSTTLNNFLVQNGLTTNQLRDEDGLRHCNRPPSWKGHGAPRTVVYLYGNPLHAIQSHYARNQAQHQALKTSGKNQFHNFPQTFGDCVKMNEDLFGAIPHFDNWLRTPTEYEIVFVRYENMFELSVAQKLLQICFRHKDSKDEIEELANSFHQLYQQRNSQEVVRQYSGIYADVIRIMQSLPPIFVRSPTGEIRPL